MTSRNASRAVDVDRANADSVVRVDAALDAFVVEHYDRLVRLARLICRDGSDAADAVQVALEQAWRRRSTLRDPVRLRPWLDRIVVREAIRISRSRTSWLGRIFPIGSDVTWIEPADRRAEQSELRTVDVATGMVHTLVADEPDIITLLGWSPAGDELLYSTSGQAGRTALWTVNVDGTRPTLVAGAESGYWQPVPTSQ